MHHHDRPLPVAGAPATSAIPQGTSCTGVQGAGDDVLVPELREADPGGVQGPVVAADALAPNPLFVVEGTCRTDVQGAGDDVLVPELREAEPGGVKGPVVAVAARALNHLFVVEATPHADVPGVGDAVPVPEVREAGPGGVTLFNAGTPHADVVREVVVMDVLAPRPQEAAPIGVQGPVVSASTQAPNPLLVVDNNDDAEAGRGGARRRRWGWGWTCRGCRAG